MGLFGKNSEIYALVVKGTVDIQGLVSLQNNSDAKAIYIQWMCSAPQNNKLLTENIKYSGVGGHLFAIAGKNRKIMDTTAMYLGLLQAKSYLVIMLKNWERFQFACCTNSILGFSVNR